MLIDPDVVFSSGKYRRQGCYHRHKGTIFVIDLCLKFVVMFI